jgi:hypothetical protein
MTSTMSVTVLSIEGGTLPRSVMLLFKSTDEHGAIVTENRYHLFPGESVTLRPTVSVT